MYKCITASVKPQSCKSAQAFGVWAQMKTSIPAPFALGAAGALAMTFAVDAEPIDRAPSGRAAGCDVSV
jgi:hypothetical protein